MKDWMLPAGLLAGGAVLYLSSRQGQATTGAAPSPASGQGGLFGSSPLSLSINVPSGSQVPAIPSVPDLTKVAASVLPQAPAIPSVPDLTKVAASVLPDFEFKVSGLEGFDPLAGLKDFKPLAGFQEGLKDFNPFAGLEGFDPLAGLKDFKPLEGFSLLPKIELPDAKDLGQNIGHGVADLGAGLVGGILGGLGENLSEIKLPEVKLLEVATENILGLAQWLPGPMGIPAVNQISMDTFQGPLESALESAGKSLLELLKPLSLPLVGEPF